MGPRTWGHGDSGTQGLGDVVREEFGTRRREGFEDVINK